MNDTEDTIDTRERQLMEAYVAARKKREDLERESADAWRTLEKSQKELVDYLTDVGKRSTGKYEDIGCLTVTEPIASVKIREGRREEAYEFVRGIGASDCIKETIHHATFASLIREQIEQGRDVPEFVEVSWIPQVKYLKP